MIKISLLFFLSLGLLPAQSVFTIEGRLVDDIRGQAIQNVRLVLSGDNLQIPPVTFTSPDGKFAFSVPAGRYKITGEKAGFFPIPSEEIEVRAKVELGDVTLTTKRSITGTLTWRDGEPVLNTIMTAYQVKEGKANGSIGGEGTRPDDRGMFVIGGLRPGRYVVAMLGSEVPGIVPRGIVPMPRDPATAIDLIDASESTVSIVFDERTGVDIEGKVALTTNVPIGTNVTVELRPSDGAPSVVRVNARAGEPFKLPKVPPGTYQLLATRQYPAEVQFGIQTIQVGGSPIRDLTVTIPDSAPLTGTIMMEDPAGPMPAANVNVRAYSNKYALNSPIGRSDAKGAFRVIATMPGEEYQLSIESLPPGTYVGAVTQGEHRILRDPFVVAANGEPVQILLKKDGGKINGQLPPRSGLFRPAFVVLAPKDRQLTSAFKTMATDRKRAFQFSGIAPGGYDLFAFDQESDYLGDESLKKYAARSVSVTVEPNAVLSVPLEIVNGK